VDGGARVETPADRYLRIEAQGGGAHVVQAIYKGDTEQLSRWYEPLAGAISFIGAEADAPAEPLHPLRSGHRIIADRFAPILEKIIGR